MKIASLRQMVLLLILFQGIFFNVAAQSKDNMNLALNKAVYHQVKQYFFCPYNDTYFRKEVQMYNFAGHLATDGSMSTRWATLDKADTWLYVDLQAICKIDKILIHWHDDYAQTYSIEVSANARDWQEVYSTNSGTGHKEWTTLTKIQARYVRINFKKSISQNGFSIRELEVLGTGNNQPGIINVTSPNKEGHIYLTGGNWKIQKASYAFATGFEISSTGFIDADWLPATVPGTVLTSYLNAGAIPNPYFADQQLMISDSFFTAPFWYRNVFTVPFDYKGFTTMLNFDGINYKAEVYVNGKFLGRINEVFKQARFDISSEILYGGKNSLAVLVYPPDNPGQLTVQSLKSAGANSGVLSQDSPTFFSSLGWDWIPTIRGRNTGIWNHVHISKTGVVKIIDPYLISIFPTPNFSSAILALQLEIQNVSDVPQNGILKGSIADIKFEKTIKLNASEKSTYTFTNADFPQFAIKNPRLWWPNGYGEQNLYPIRLAFELNNIISDVKEFNFGIRKVECDTSGQILKLKVNEQRVFVRGGNWGLPEAMLNIDKEGYETRVRLHKEMNFNMIRNWVGQTAHSEFYDACDKYGILVWDEFWLSNEMRGFVPADYEKFMDNAIAKIKDVRNHPSVAFYCGRNENYPPENLQSQLDKEIKILDPFRIFIPSSIHSPVNGSGPWSLNEPKWYFQNRGGTKVAEKNNNSAIYSELGMPNIPPIESMLKIFPVEKLWPQNDMWGLHDFTLANAQDCRKYNESIINRYGEVDNILDFCQKAQLLNMESHKAMFEAFASKEKSNGLLMWMSQSAWPSLVWQTYDYFFEPGAAYFACKKASEPLHIMWDCLNEEVLVRNNTGIDLPNLKAEVRIYDINGKLKYSEPKLIEAPNDKVISCFKIKYPENLTKLHFLKLLLKIEETVLSENFYWREPENLDYKDLNYLPETKLLAAMKKEIQNGLCFINTELKNPTDQIVVMVRLKVVKEKTRENVLPIFYEDNYFALTPGENKKVHIEFREKYLDNQDPILIIEGWKVIPGEVASTSKLSPLKEVNNQPVPLDKIIRKKLEIEPIIK